MDKATWFQFNASTPDSKLFDRRLMDLAAAHGGDLSGRIIVLIATLVFVNISYFMISFNLTLIVSDSNDAEIEEISLASNTNNDFSLSDLLDLDLLDFDVEELAESYDIDECEFKSLSEIVVA